MTIGDGLFRPLFSQGAGGRTVSIHDYPAVRGYSPDEGRERFPNRGKRSVVIQVIWLDGRHDGDLRVQRVESSIEFIRFNHEKSAATQASARSKGGNHATDEGNRVEAGPDQDCC